MAAGSGFVPPEARKQEGFVPPEVLAETPKKKVPTEAKPVKPTGQESSVGLKTTQPTSGSGSSLPSEYAGITPIDQWGKNLYTQPEKTKQDKNSFETFIDQKLSAVPAWNQGKSWEELDEDKLNIYLYREYLAESKPDKLKQFDEKVNYKSWLGNEMPEEEKQRAKAEFYEEALSVKQAYLNTKAEKLKKATQTPEFLNLQKQAADVNSQLQSLNQSAEQGQISQQEYTSVFGQLQNRASELQNQIQPFVDAQTKLMDQFERNEKEATEFINRYPLEAQRRLLDKTKQIRNDVLYEVNPFAFRNFSETSAQIGQSVTNFVAKTLSIPQVVSMESGYGWTDRLADMANNWAESINKDYFPTPSKFDRPLVGRDPMTDELQFNTELLLPKTVRTLSDMAIMVAPAMTGLGLSGTVAASYALTAKDAYDEGIKAGLTQTQASLFGNSIGLTTGLLELINPEAALIKKGIIKTSAEQAAKRLSEGVKWPEILTEVSKQTFINIGKENLQEFTQLANEKIQKYAANQLIGADFDLGDLEAEALETLILTSIVAGVAGGGIGGIKSKKSDLEKQAIYSGSVNPDMIDAALQKQVQSGKMDERTANIIGGTVRSLSENLSMIPDNVPELEKSEIINGIYDKMNLLKSLGDTNIDDGIRKVYEDRVKKIDAGIAKIIQKYSDESGIPMTEDERVKSDNATSQPTTPQPESVTMEWSGDDVKAKNVTLDAKSIQSELDNVDFDIEVFNERVGKGFVSNEQITESYIDAKQNGNNPELIDAVEALIGSQPQPNAVQEQSTTGVPVQPEAVSSEEVRQGDEQTAVQETPQESRETEKVTTEQLVSVKETLPTATAGEVAALIKDGTIPDMLERGVMDDLELMRIVDKLGLPMPQFLLDAQTENFANEMGYRTEEEDAELLDLINKAQERTGIPMLEETPKESKEIEKVSQSAGIKATNLRDLYNISRDLFGQNRVKSLASAVIMDRMIGQMAKRAGISKSEMYGRLEFKKADSVLNALELENALFQATINGKIVQLRNMDVDVVNGFYSPIEKRLAETKIEKQSANKWIAVVGKGDEATWTGVKAWLESKQPTEQVSKSEIQQWMKDNRINVVEVVKGGEARNYKLKSDPPKDLGIDRSEALDILYKADNIDNPRLPEFMENRYGSSGKDILVWLKENAEDVGSYSKDVKFETYQLEGEKSDYKEVLVTLPSAVTELPGNYKTEKTAWDTYQIKDEKGNVISESGGLAQATVDALAKINKDKGSMSYIGGHFSEPNILVHLRMNTRTDANGDKVLFLEEVQSDWGQKGKKEGFAENDLPKGEKYRSIIEEYENNKVGDIFIKGAELFYKDSNGELISTRIENGKPIMEEAGPVDPRGMDFEGSIRAGKGKQGIVSAPFVTDTNAWVKLALKVALKEAVKQGADKIAWTTGEQQNERYDLSKTYKTVNVIPNEDGTYIVAGIDKEGRNVFQKNNVKENEIEELVGKEIAEKAITEKQTRFEGVDLKVGGKGMIGFYGSPKDGKLGIVGQVAESLFKQKVGAVDVETKPNYAENDTYVTSTDKAYNLYSKVGDKLLSSITKTTGDGFSGKELHFELVRLANKYTKEKIQSTQPSITITPELKASVEAGLPLFQNKKGAAMVAQDGTAIIYALTDPNISTPLHELAHVFEHYLTDAERNAVIKAAKTKEWTRETSEYFARGFEKYLAEGISPVKELQKIFDKFKEWLTEIYNGIKGSDIDIKLNKPMKAIYDSMIADKPDISQQERIEKAKQRIDDAAELLKKKLRIDLPEGTKKMGFGQDEFIDLVASAVKVLVEKGIKATDALNQVIEALKDGGFITNKEEKSVRSKALSLIDADMEKVYVSKTGEFTVIKDDNGFLYVRDDKGKPVTASKKKKIVKEFIDNYKFDTGKRAEVTEGVREDEIVRFIADNSENPQEILEELSRVKEKLDQSDLDPVELAIALGMRFIKTSSFLYSGDRNLMKKGDLSFDDVSDNIKLNYLRKNGTPIDLVAQEIEYAMMGYSDGSAVTPSDIIDFIFKYPKGPSQFLNQKTPEYQMLADRFYELTGFDPTPEMINQATKQTEEDFAGLEPETDKDDIKEVSEPRQKKRRFTEQVMTDANVSGQAKAKVTSSQIWYQELPNVLSLAEANAKIDEVGEDAAMSAVSNLDNSISSAARAIIGQVLIRRFEAQGNYDKAIDMLEVITKQATASGQFIQAFSLWARLTPEGQLRVAQREVNKQANIRAKADKNKIAKTKKIVKEVIESAATQASENVLGKRTQEEKKSTYGAKNKIVTKERANELRAKLKAKRGQLFSNPISEEVIELAAYHLEASGRKAAEFTSSILKEFGYAAIPRMRELYDKAKAMLGDSVQYESSSEVDKKIKLITMDFEAERQGKIEDAIHKKFDRAIKMKSSKLFKAAMAQLMDSENPEAIWDKYKSYAAQRLKTFVATSIQNDADSSPVLKDFIDGLIQNIRGKLDESLPDKEKSEKLPKSAVNILSDALKNFEKYQDVWGETQKALQKKYKDNPDKLQEIDEYFGAILDTPFSKKLVEKTVKEGLKSMGVSIAKIARDHFTVFDATKKTLTEKLIDQAELSEDQATILADAISKEFDRLINDAKKKMLDRLVKEKAVKRDVAPVLETELMKLLNLGGFSDAEFMESWAKANGYPALTEENIKEISRLADIVAKYDDGFEKFRAMEDLLAYQQTIKGIDWKETMMSIWYAHVLSGYTTQMVNVVSTGINSFFEYARIISKQPLDARIIANGWWNGIKYGLLEGGEVLKSGYNPIRGKLEIPATLEIISKMNKGKFNYAHAAKYVRRVMVAADVVFFEGLREMRAYQEAAKLARMEKKSDPGIDVKKRALAILNKTDVDLQNAIEQSDSEYEIKVNEINNSGATVSEKKRLLTQAKKDRLRRVFEINQNQRSPEIQEILKEFAARATFNYTPEGFLGSGARAVNIWANSVPALRYFIPFTNIIANVANEAINYTPLGYVRALNNGSIISRYNREDGITTDERNDLLIKATMAMSAFATVMALTTDWDEDDDEPALLEITASATGDFKKNYNLEEEDYQEYSFRVWNAEKKEYGPWISYRYTPLVIMFSIAGFVSDTKKYNKDKYPDALDIVLASAMVGMKTFLDMSFLSTIDTFLDALFDKYDTNKWDQFMKTLLNIGKNFVIPNLYTQTAKEVQSIMGIGIKETTLRFDDPKTIIATYIQDIPYARNIYNDRINGLGEIIIPKTSKFVSGNMFFDRDPDPLWKVIADKGMLNLKVPSIKTVKVPDPNNRNLLTTLTDDEYFEFAKARGQYIKSELSKVVDGKRKIRVDRKLQRKLQAEGKTVKVGRMISEYDILDADWMTEVQKEATEIAKLKVVEMREKSIK